MTTTIHDFSAPAIDGTEPVQLADEIEKAL